jgi:hypothetical protein
MIFANSLMGFLQGHFFHIPFDYVTFIISIEFEITKLLYSKQDYPDGFIY